MWLFGRASILRVKSCWTNLARKCWLLIWSRICEKLEEMLVQIHRLLLNFLTFFLAFFRIAYVIDVRRFHCDQMVRPKRYKPWKWPWILVKRQKKHMKISKFLILYHPHFLWYIWRGMLKMPLQCQKIKPAIWHHFSCPIQLHFGYNHWREQVIGLIAQSAVFHRRVEV